MVFSPSTVTFASVAATPTTVAISETHFTGTFSTPSPTPAGIATISGFTSGSGVGSFTIAPSSNGTTSVYVGNIGGTGQTAYLPVVVNGATPTPPPTPGALTFSPSSITFPNPSATATTVAISQVAWTGPWSVCVALPGFVTSSISSSTLTIAPAGTSSGTNNLGICGSSVQGNLPITVIPTPTPTPGAISLNPNPLNLIGTGTATPTPGAVTITEPNYTGPWAVAAPSPAGIASATISGNTITVSSVAAGSTSFSISCSGGSVCSGVSPTPLAVTVSPTPGPIDVSQVTTTFPNPSATATTVAVSESNYAGSFSISAPTPAAIFSASIPAPGVGNTGGSSTITLGPPLSAGNGTVTVSDTNGQSKTLTVSVIQTPGPLTYSPSGTIMMTVGGSSVNVTLSDPYNTSAITASPTPAGQVSASAVTLTNSGSSTSGGTLTLSPTAAGTPTVNISDGVRSTNIPVTIATATPGAIVANPSSVTFAAQAGAQPTPTTVALSESNYSGTFSAGSANANVMTSTVSGSTVTITPVSGGTANVNVSNQSTQTTTIPVTVNTPAPVYTNMAPWPQSSASPIAVTWPTPGVYTFLAQIRCNTNTNGSNILSIRGSSGADFALEAGNCNSTATSNATNPTTAMGAHVFALAPANTQSLPTYSLIGGPVSTQDYIIAGTENGSYLTYWYCTYNPAITCSNATPVGAAATTWTGTNGFIAGANSTGNPTDRVFQGDIWNVVEYPTALLWPSGASPAPSVMATWVAANYATPDPYATPTQPPATPTPIATIPQPYSNIKSNPTAAPLSTTLPTPGSGTFIAQVLCGSASPGPVASPNTLGNSILDLGGGGTAALYMEAGVCNGASAPTPGPGAPHTYVSTGQQATAANQLSAATSYIIAVTVDGSSTLAYYVCSYPSIACTQATVSDTQPLTYTTGLSYIGADSTGTTTPGSGTATRYFVGDIWNFAEYNQVLATTATGMASALTGMTTGANPLIGADPYPSPTASSSSISCAPTSSQTYPIYSACFTGNTPFHHTWATLYGGGNGVYGSVPGGVTASAFVAQGFSGFTGTSFSTNESGGMGPQYWVFASTPEYTLGGCSSGYCAEVQQGISNIWLPSNWTPQAATDHHLTSIDTIHNNGEIDGTDSCTGSGPGNPTCGYSGYFAFTGNGLSLSNPRIYNAGNAGGYANGLFEVSAQDILNYTQKGIHIGHALGLEMYCLASSPANGNYPSGHNADGTPCSGSTASSPVYGGLVHLKTSVNVTSVTSDPVCQAVLFALQDYGGYPADYNGTGIQPVVEYARSYNSGTGWSANPWWNNGTFWTTNTASTIAASNMNNTDGCLSYVTSASDWEFLYLNGTLPTAVPYWSSTGTPSG